MAIRRLGRPPGYDYPVGLNFLSNTVIDYLVIAGGGGGGGGDDGPTANTLGGGGGAGGFLTGLQTLNRGSASYAVTVGGGAPAQTTQNDRGSNGSFSLFRTSAPANTIYAYAVGGGGGGGYKDGPGAQRTAIGSTGGSGGGQGTRNLTTETNPPAALGTSQQGNNGGLGGTAWPGVLTFDSCTTGGGGGAGAVGNNGTTAPAGVMSGNGGIGLASTISGSPVVYAGGGGGATAKTISSRGIGGDGGGGSGGYGSTAPGNSGTSGTANRGGGGGGGGAAKGDGGAGGSGIVIIRYGGSTQLATGGTVTTPSGYVVHTFTGDGTFTTNSTFGVTGSFYDIN